MKRYSVLACTLLLSLVGIAHAQKAELNKPLPTFSLVNVATDKAIGSTEVATGKKATVLLFVSVQCPVSNAYNSRMEEIAKAYSAKGIAFVGVNSNSTEPQQRVASHAKTSGFTFPIGKDLENKFADQLGARVTPEVFVTDKNGVLVYHGPIDDNRDSTSVTKHYLTDALDAILADKPVPVASARAFGCSIKRQ